MGQPSMHPIRLRWQGRCHRCGCLMKAGTAAEFDHRHHELWCLRCADGQLELPLPAPATSCRSSGSPPRPSAAERARIKELIEATKATLQAHRRAG